MYPIRIKIKGISLVQLGYMSDSYTASFRLVTECAVKSVVMETALKVQVHSATLHAILLAI